MPDRQIYRDPLQKGAYEDLRQYITLYDQVQVSIQREKRILWGLVGQVFPELLQEFKELSGEIGRSPSGCLYSGSGYPPVESGGLRGPSAPGLPG